MSKVRIKLNRAGMRQMLRSPEVLTALGNAADEITGRCGDGYESGSSVGRERALAYARAATKEARQDNHDNNTLLKAVRG